VAFSRVHASGAPTHAITLLTRFASGQLQPSNGNDGRNGEPERERQQPTDGVSGKSVGIGEGRRRAAKEGLDRLLRQRSHNKRRKIPVWPPQRWNIGQEQQADNQEEDGVSDEMIVRVAKDHAEWDAKRRPDLTEPVEREPQYPQER
jgi:hypothetical protein